MITHEDFLPPGGTYQQLEIVYDARLRSVRYTLVPRNRPCFNRDLLGELEQFQHRLQMVVRGALVRGEPNPVRFTVLASSVPGVFNMGGDLRLFTKLIKKGDRQDLFLYAKACIDVLYPNFISFDLPVTTISLVQGDALGGGFEAAVSSNVVISERSAKWGLPEVLFNLIPGMGAYSFLARRLTPELVDRVVMSGKMLSAQEMFDLRLVDLVVEDGEGDQAALSYMNGQRRRSNAHAAMSRVRHCVNPVTYEELIAVTKIWVDAALNLTERDLKLMERLIRAQDRRVQQRSVMEPEAMEGQA